MEQNLLMIRRTDERWQIMRTREADEQKKSLISYTWEVQNDKGKGQGPKGEPHPKTDPWGIDF